MQVYGDFTDISIGDEQVFAYTRSLGNSTALVILNFTAKETEFLVDDNQGFRFVLGNYYPPTSQPPIISGNAIPLHGFEGRLYIRSCFTSSGGPVN